MTIALAAFAIAANAQFIVGGNLGFNMSSGTSVETNILITGTRTEEIPVPKIMNLSIAPKFGYQLTDNMAAGIIVGYTMGTSNRTITTPVDITFIAQNASGNMTEYSGNIKSNTSTISIEPFFRYNLIEFNDLVLFLEASVPINIHPLEKTMRHEEGTYGGKKHTIDVETLDNAWNSYGVSITPGLSYLFNENLSMDIYINACNIAYTLTQTDNSTDSFENNETIATTHNFGFNVHTLPTAAVSLGFNYSF